MENGPFEDVSPTKNGDIPTSYFSLLVIYLVKKLEAIFLMEATPKETQQTGSPNERWTFDTRPIQVSN